MLAVWQGADIQGDESKPGASRGENESKRMRERPAAALRLDRWRVFAGIAVSVAVLAAAAPRAEATRIAEMYRMEARPLGAPAGVTQDQVRHQVVELAKSNGWTVYVRTHGVVEADFSLSAGKHRASVAIVCDDLSFVCRSKPIDAAAICFQFDSFSVGKNRLSRRFFDKP